MLKQVFFFRFFFPQQIIKLHTPRSRKNLEAEQKNSLEKQKWKRDFGDQFCNMDLQYGFQTSPSPTRTHPTNSHFSKFSTYCTFPLLLFLLLISVTSERLDVIRLVCCLLRINLILLGLLSYFSSSSAKRSNTHAIQDEFRRKSAKLVSVKM